MISVVIPSRNRQNLESCIMALRKHEPTLQVIIIDDGVDWTDVDWTIYQPAVIQSGVKPFVYAEACNRGILHDEHDDIILLNDDAMLESPAGFTMLQWLSERNPEFGLIGAALDSCGTPSQIAQPPGNGIRVLPVMCVFAAVFIPRTTINRIGLLDERFSVGADGIGPRGYGCEDDDYSWRVRRAGLKLGVYDGCFCNHTTLPSTFRTPDYDHMAGVRIHEEVFLKKWGIHPRRPIDFETGARIHAL